MADPGRAQGYLDLPPGAGSPRALPASPYRGLLPALALFALIAPAYAIGAELSWHSFGAGPGFAFFPPAGVTVTALLLTGRRRWPAVITAIVVTELAVDLQHGLTLPLAIGFAAANAVEPVVGALCVRALCPRGPDLAFRSDLLRFIAGACVLGPIAGALIGATVLTISTNGWWPGPALQWWAGDGVAVLVVGGPLLLWRRRRAVVSSRWAEMALLVVVTAGLSIVSFPVGGPPGLLLLPVLALAAFRLGDIGVVVAGAVLAFTANYMTAAGHGEFAHLRLSPSAELALTQAYIAVVIGVCWLMAQEIDGRLRAVQERETARVDRDRADIRREAAELASALSLMWKQPQRFEPGQLAFVQAVAEFVSQALVRAREYEDEHAIAAVLQRAVMPRVPSQIPGLDVGWCYRPAGTARGIGGDWYDALALPHGGVYITVGDAVGHGMAAAEDMTQLRNAGRALAVEGHQPAGLLTELDRLTASATNGQFATMAVAIFQPDVCLVSYAFAGHPPILVRRAQTGRVEVLPRAGGPALGAFDNPTYTQGQTTAEPGDIMLLYSDGLIERRGEDLKAGIARVGRRLAAWQPGAPLQPLCGQLVTGLVPRPQADDMCALAVRPTGKAAATGDSEIAGS